MKVVESLNLVEYNSYRINSKCNIAFFPECEEDVISFFSKYQEYVLLGSGHNVILSKSSYNKPFLIFNGNFNKIKLHDKRVFEVEAGAMMWDVSKLAFENSLSGLEIFYDIPSSLGGAVVMNAGASGEEIKDVLMKVRYLDLSDFRVKELSNDELQFEYRSSFFQKNTNKIVLKAWLKLSEGNSLDIKNKMDNIKAQRFSKQPKEFPNCGSVFKRPKGFYVGALIDELNLKGFSSGGAKISEKHGGFIINFDGAKGEDIIKIIRVVKDRVYNKFGIQLEVEQRII